MEDNLGTGSDNKIPLIIGIGAIAVAVLALAFAIKAKGDAKSFQGELEKIKTDYALKADASAASSVASGASATAQETAGKLAELTQYVTGSVAPAIQAQKQVLEGLVKRGAPTGPTNGHTAPVVAGPGEYVVKKGDTGVKIARANGVSISALTAVNPGVNFSTLKIGQKLKLPEKK